MKRLINWVLFKYYNTFKPKEVFKIVTTNPIYKIGEVLVSMQGPSFIILAYNKEKWGKDIYCQYIMKEYKQPQLQIEHKEEDYSSLD